MDNNRYKYSFVKMALRLNVSVRSYYDYRGGFYGLREQRKSQNKTLVRDCFEHIEQLYGAVRISGELCAIVCRETYKSPLCVGRVLVQQKPPIRRTAKPHNR